LIVIDASAVVEMLLGSAKGWKVEQRVLGSGESLHAPHLLDLEVTQVMRRYLQAKALTPSRAQMAFDDFRALKYRRYPHDVLLKRIWSLRDNFTAYDAAYLALAEEIGATVVTCDGKMAGSGHNAKVEVV
jgi:predicted nucleic acid-binding protein